MLNDSELVDTSAGPMTAICLLESLEAKIPMTATAAQRNGRRQLAWPANSGSAGFGAAVGFGTAAARFQCGPMEIDARRPMTAPDTGVVAPPPQFVEVERLQ